MPDGRECIGSDGTTVTGQRWQRIAAIVNTAVRRGAGDMSHALKTGLDAWSDLRIHVVGSSREATEAARHHAAWADIVVAVGGDGTVSNVATGIFGSSVALGIIPAGSTNIVARSLGIPSQPEAAMTLLIGDHVPRQIDVGRSGDRSFLNMAGVGFDAEIFRGADPAWKRRLGWLAYLPAAATALRVKPSLVRVSVDGVLDEVTSPLVLVANGGAAITPAFEIYPGIAVDDGWLDVLIFTAATPVQIAATLGSAGRRRLDRSPHVIWRRGRTVLVDATPPLMAELDGDVIGATPRGFHLAPAAMTVITPPR
ncbi:MAG: diacylglycerol/lipid kinase family protein [Thermomicrobiales bacterium]